MNIEKQLQESENLNQTPSFAEQFKSCYGIFITFPDGNTEVNMEQMRDHLQGTLTSNLEVLFPGRPVVVSIEAKVLSRPAQSAGFKIKIHANPEINTEFIEMIKKRYHAGEINPTLIEGAAGSVYLQLFETGKFNVDEYIKKIALDENKDNRLLGLKKYTH